MSKKEKKISAECPLLVIKICATFVFLLGITGFLINTDVFFNPSSEGIIKMVASLGMMVSAYGIFSLKEWGLYVYGASILLPLVALMVDYSEHIISFIGVANILVFFYLLIVCRECACGDKEESERYSRLSFLYLRYVLLIAILIALIAIFSVVSCAYDENSKAQSVTSILNLGGMVDWVRGLIG